MKDRRTTADGGIDGSAFRTQVIQPGEDTHSAIKRAKLVAIKEKWAREGRGLTGETYADGSTPRGGRTPPGQHLVKNWPVLDLGEQPAIDRRDWSLTVAGQVANPLRWAWRDLQAQSIARQISDIHCVTAWSRLDNRWEGVSVAHLLSLVNPLPSVKFVVARGFDGYATDIPIEPFRAPGALLATAWEGEPLTREHGGPVRLMIPRLYFWKSAKWLRHLLFIDKPSPGFWEARGYHGRGDPWKEERYGGA